MHLTPRELDKLLTYSLAEIALKRKAKASSSITPKPSPCCRPMFSMAPGKGERLKT